MITLLIVLSVVAVVALVAVLAAYLFWVGKLLGRVAGNLTDADRAVATIAEHGTRIGPGVEHINRAGTSVAGAMPLLYGLAEQIVAKVTPSPSADGTDQQHVPAGLRRSSQ